MKIIERYALACGSKINRPELNTKFFPIPFEKYLTFNAASTNMPAKNYQYWNDVFSIILPELNKQGVGVIQLGDVSEPQFGGIHRYNGQTSLAQSCHIIKNAMMHLGVDSMLAHAADAFNTKICAIYSVSGPETCGPYFSDKDNCALIEPNFKADERYYYNPQSPNLANSIKPEQIVEGISKLLNIGFEKTKTLHISPGYGQVVIELIPDTSILSPAQFPGAIPVIRYDLGGTEHVIYSQLQHRKCIVYTDKKLDTNVLSTLKPNIDRVVLEVKELNADGGARPEDLEFIKSVMSAGIQLTTLTALPDDKIGFLKLDLSEYTVILPKPVGKRPENIRITDKTWGKSSKIICGANQTFVSYCHYKNNLPILNNSNTFKMIDDPLLWESSGEFLFIFNKE